MTISDFCFYNFLYIEYLILLFCWNQVIDKSFGFDTAVEEAQRAINAAHVEASSVENGIGLVKLMGRYSGTSCDLASFHCIITRHIIYSLKVRIHVREYVSVTL